MSNSQTADIEALRQSAMGGTLRLGLFCANIIEKSERQGYNYAADGMPHFYIGNTCYVPVEAAMQWLRGRRQRNYRNPEPRGRGRPRKAA
jgi:hypothetical protein